MAGTKWERYAAATGIAGVVVFAVQAFIVPVAPTVSDPLPTVVNYYVRNHIGVRIQLFLSGLAGILLLWFLGSLVAHLRRAEGEGGRLSTVTLAGFVGAAAPFAVGALATAGLALEAGRFSIGSIMPVMQLAPVVGLDAGAARVLSDLRWLSYDFAWFAIAPAVAAVAVISYRHGAFPKWHANFGYALFFLAIVAGAGIFFDSGPFAPGGGVSYVTFLAFLAWTGIASGLIMQAAAGEEPPPAEEAQAADEG